MILIGRNDADALATGWHPAHEGPAGVPCRWMSPQAVVRLMPRAGASGLCITISAPARIRGMSPGLSAYAADHLLGHCAELGEEGAWSTAWIYFNSAAFEKLVSLEDPVTLTLAVENCDEGCVPLAFVPHEVLGNGDLRELGAQISSIRWITE